MFPNLSRYLHRQLRAQVVVTQVLEGQAAGADEFGEGFVLALQPAGVVEVFVEDEDGAGANVRAHELENGLGGGVEVRVQVQQERGLRVRGQEGR